MNKIIQVAPTEQYFVITWKIGLRCNYDCMYCSPEYHNNTDGYHDLKTLQNVWCNMHGKTAEKSLKYKIAFTGGEPTVNKSFLPFVKWIRENYNQNIGKILVTTNGSANLSYYKKLYKYVDNISFSVHSEHINEEKFFSMVQALKNSINESKFLHVNVMNEFWNTIRIEKYKDFLTKNQISFTVNEIDYAHQTRTIPIFKGKLNIEQLQ